MWHKWLISRQAAYLARIAGLVILAEQLAEVAFKGVSLAEHPGAVIGALALLGAPLPEHKDQSE